MHSSTTDEYSTLRSLLVGGTTYSFKELESNFIEATLKYSAQDDLDKTRMLNTFLALDQLINDHLGNDAFLSSERLQKAYEQLQKAPTTTVFEKGLPRLKEARQDIWRTSTNG